MSFIFISHHLEKSVAFWYVIINEIRVEKFAELRQKSINKRRREKMEGCIFCKIANGEIPAATLWEDEDFRVILDLGPASKGHALILPKTHAANIYAVSYTHLVLIQ